MFNHVLLCTHGTDGARKAEAFIFEQLEADPHLKVTVLTVLDEDWREMTGDDWLNSSKTHTTFLDHVENQMNEEIAEEWQRIKKTYPAAEQVDFLQRTGSIAGTITKVAKELGCDLITIGPYGKKKKFSIYATGMGLKARMENQELHPLLPCPLLIAP
ncbi:MAG: universal stress protein [Thermodesulfobacteriota bacterium]|nr:universal stress protein [Thermodesulfobacteriota bacterium]